MRRRSFVAERRTRCDTITMGAEGTRAGTHLQVTAHGSRQVQRYAAQCPTRQALDRIADKWTALIVGLLAERTHRFGERRRGIEGISHKVLVQTLRSLERDGLVHRAPLPTNPPTVEYSLTSLGRTLVAPLATIRDWAEQHIHFVAPRCGSLTICRRRKHNRGVRRRQSYPARRMP